jgi:hypothetical protein
MIVFIFSLLGFLSGGGGGGTFWVCGKERGRGSERALM